MNRIKEIWDANKCHTVAEIIDGFPDGNVLVGMTQEDYDELTRLIDEGE